MNNCLGRAQRPFECLAGCWRENLALNAAEFSSAYWFRGGIAAECNRVRCFNADGKLDLATANGAGNTVSVLLNTTTTGAASLIFRAQVQFPTGTAPYGLAVGDINGDGKPDLLVANVGASTNPCCTIRWPQGRASLFFLRS